MKIRSTKKYYSKFVKIKFVSSSGISFITGTIIELHKDFLRLKVNDEKEKAKVFYEKIISINELQRVTKKSGAAMVKRGLNERL